MSGSECCAACAGSPASLIPPVICVAMSIAMLFTIARGRRSSPGQKMVNARSSSKPFLATLAPSCIGACQVSVRMPPASSSPRMRAALRASTSAELKLCRFMIL